MKRILIFILTMVSAFTVSSQETEKLVLNIREAQEYAISHNKALTAARFDIRAAEMAKWDVISAGLPKVDGSASLADNLKLMTTLLPGEIVGQPAGTYIPVQFGTKYNTSYSLQVTQLVFSAPYLVGIQMASLSEKLTSQVFEKSELDTREGIVVTYYLILISEESLRTINANIENLKTIKSSTESMYSVGMAELTDVDQINLNISMLENSRKSIERNIEYTMNLLRLQLGAELESEIELTTTLDMLIAEADIEGVLGQNFDYQANIDFVLLTTQEKMSELTLKSQKAAVLPSLSTFYSWNKSGQGNKLNDLQWFPNSMLGFQLNVPIFASGQRYSRIRKAQFELEKTRTNKSLVSDNLILTEKQLRFNLLNAWEQYQSNKENIDVAKRILDSVNNKYREGLASSLDVTQAQNGLLTAEGNHAGSILTLLQTKLALQKLTNNF